MIDSQTDGRTDGREGGKYFLVWIFACFANVQLEKRSKRIKSKDTTTKKVEIGY